MSHHGTGAPAVTTTVNDCWANVDDVGGSFSFSHKCDIAPPAST